MKKKITVIVSIISIVFVMAFALAACNKETKPGYTALSAQADVFKELNAKTADVGIMDYTMANYLLSVDSAMAKNLTIADVAFEKEYYGIAFRRQPTANTTLSPTLSIKFLLNLKTPTTKQSPKTTASTAQRLTLSTPNPRAKRTIRNSTISKTKAKSSSDSP